MKLYLKATTVTSGGHDLPSLFYFFNDQLLITQMPHVCPLSLRPPGSWTLWGLTHMLPNPAFSTMEDGGDVYSEKMIFVMVPMKTSTNDCISGQAACGGIWARSPDPLVVRGKGFWLVRVVLPFGANPYTFCVGRCSPWGAVL